MTRYIKRGGQVWIKIFPDKPVTEKPAETRMGSGKGLPSTGLQLLSPAACCLRSPACPMRTAREALRLAAQAAHQVQVRQA